MAGLIQLGPFEDANRKLLANVSVPFYLPGTSTLADLFTDAAGTLPAANPVTTDDFGNLPARFTAPGLYEWEVRGLRLTVEVGPPHDHGHTDLATATHGHTDLATQASLDTHTTATTTAHGGIVASTDSRLSDSRTPTAHGASHATAGTDPLTPADIGAATAGHGHPGVTDTDLATQAELDAHAATPHGGTETAHIVLVSDAVNTSGTTMTELANQRSRVYADLSGASTVVAQLLPANLPRSDAQFEFSTDNGSTWATLLTIPVADMTANVLTVTTSAAIPAAAKAECLLRILAHGTTLNQWQIVKASVSVKS